MSDRKLTDDDLALSMRQWVQVAHASGSGRRMHYVTKALEFCPATGEFRILASGRSQQIRQTRATALSAYNAVKLGDLTP